MTAYLMKMFIGCAEMPLIARRDRQPTIIAARVLSLSNHWRRLSPAFPSCQCWWRMGGVWEEENTGN